jgi:hypothetical protein
MFEYLNVKSSEDLLKIQILFFQFFQFCRYDFTDIPLVGINGFIEPQPMPKEPKPTLKRSQQQFEEFSNINCNYLLQIKFSVE